MPLIPNKLTFAGGKINQLCCENDWMAELEIKLKIGSHYQTLSLKSLYEQWKIDGLQSYSFSKAQLTRIKKQFEEFAHQLNPTVQSSSGKVSEIPPAPTFPNEQCSEYKELNLDVYDETDFIVPCTQVDPISNRLTYYQELLSAVNELHKHLGTKV